MLYSRGVQMRCRAEHRSQMQAATAGGDEDYFSARTVTHEDLDTFLEVMFNGESGDISNGIGCFGTFWPKKDDTGLAAYL